MANDNTGADAAADHPDAWKSRLELTDGGAVRASLLNAMTAFRHAPEWQGVLAVNELSDTVVYLKQPPFIDAGHVGPMRSHEAAYAAEWLSLHGIRVNSHVAFEALVAVAQINKFHPVRDYLDSLKWDGTPRIDRWLIDHLGAADNELNQAFGSKFLIGAVARVKRPGCKLDHMLILEGDQGIGKSTALQVLFSAPWFADRIPSLGSKDAQQFLAGKWCIEFAELESLGRAGAAEIKAFTSAPVDSYRPSYGRMTQDYPRQCVFAGTVNPGGCGYLRDETGARRFWPVECGVDWSSYQQVNTAGLAAVRNQLWAEAVVRYQAGEAWHLDNRDLQRAQAAAADERYDEDPWTDRIVFFIADKSWVTTGEVLIGALQIMVKEHNNAMKKRVGGILRHRGWIREKQRVDGEPTWGFARPAGSKPRGGSDQVY